MKMAALIWYGQLLGGQRDSAGVVTGDSSEGYSLTTIKHNASELFMTVDLRAASEMCNVYQCHLANSVIKTKCKRKCSSAALIENRIARLCRDAEMCCR